MPYDFPQKQYSRGSTVSPSVNNAESRLQIANLSANQIANRNVFEFRQKVIRKKHSLRPFHMIEMLRLM
jgi:hypothetical protein